MSDSRVVLVDGNSLLHRAFHALPPLTSPQGEPTGAVYGFISLLLRVLEELTPKYVMIAWDTKEPTFRHIEYEEYKAHRPETDPELLVQMEITPIVVESLNIPQFSQVGFEADDVIGTLATRLGGDAEYGVEVVIVTGDMDALQLVTDNVFVFTMRHGLSDTVMYDIAKVQDRYGGLLPSQLIDYKALCGDPSDNIPGVRGVGDKTAIELLSKFTDLSGVYEHIEEVTPRQRKLLTEGKESAFLSKRLATINRDVPIVFGLKDAVLSDFSKEKAVEVFSRYGFKSLIGRVLKLHVPESIGKEDAVSMANLVYPKISDVQAMITEDWCDWQKQKISDWREFNYFLAENMLTGATGKALTNEKLIFDRLHLEVEDFSKLNEKQQLDLEYALTCFYRNELQKEEYSQLRDLYYQTELPLAPILSKMSEQGIVVNVELISQYLSDYEEKIATLTREIYELVGYEFNVNSSKQLEKVLFDQLRLPVIKKTKTQRSTSETVLLKLKGLHPVIEKILDYRSSYKIKSTYLEPLLDYAKEDGKIHTTFNQYHTASGRLSSERPNLQNIPTGDELELRRVFEATEGYQLVVADYSQIELRIMAHITQDEGLLASFEHGQDIHLATAARIFNKLTSEVTASERKIGKTINFSLMYGMSAHGLSEALNIGRVEAQLYIDNYFDSYPRVKEWQERLIKKVREQGYVETLFGRRRVLPEINAKNFHKRSGAERVAINHPLQGTQADILKMAMVELVSRMKEGKLIAESSQHFGEDVRLLLQVHDELVFEVSDQRIEDVVSLVREVMEKIVILTVPLLVDIKVGPNWHDTVTA